MEQSDVKRLLAERAARELKADAFDAMKRMCYGLQPHEGGEPMRIVHGLSDELQTLKLESSRQAARIKTLVSELRTQTAMVEELSKRLRETAPYAAPGLAATDAKGVE